MAKKEQEHTRILNYLKENNGVNLKDLDENLVLCSNFNVQKKDSYYIEKYTIEERLDKLFEEVFEPYPNYCDLNCFNKKNNSLIILELKTGKADYKTFGQMLFYLLDAEVVEYADYKKVKNVQGIILASEIDESLRKLVNKYENVIPEISFKEYMWTDDKKLLIENV